MTTSTHRHDNGAQADTTTGRRPYCIDYLLTDTAGALLAALFVWTLAAL